MNKLMTVDGILSRYLPDIEAALQAAVPTDERGLNVLMRYHLGWCDAAGHPVSASSGKRIRPVLVLLAAEATGGNPLAAMPSAVAVELLHNFSLVHDDIQDRSAERRHRPTVWTIWGEAQAINAGDALHVLAQGALARSLALGVPAERLNVMLDRFSDASLRLCDGQYLDLAYESRMDIREADYLRMVSGKTAALIGCSLELGAITGSGDPAVWESYRTIGEELGLAFQIWDDYLGIWGETKITGKPVAEDITNRKKTLPVAYAFEHTSGDERAVLSRTYAPGPPNPDAVPQMLDLFERIGARDYTERLANEHIDRALAALDHATGDPRALAELVAISRYLVGRDH